MSNTRNGPGIAVAAAVFVLLALVPFVAVAMNEPFWIGFVARFMIYAIAASALNLALGMGGLVSFGHALFLGLGAYSVALPAFFGVSSGWIHLAVCLGTTGLTALMTGAISLRTTGIGFIMITLAFAQMGYFVFVSLKNFGGDDGMAITQTSRFGTLDLGSPTAVYGASLAVLLLLTCWIARMRQAPFGMVLRGAQQNARRISAIGFDARRYQLAAYVLSGMLCGVAGLLLANLNAFASPGTMAWTVSGELIVMVVLGGMGTVMGPVLGAMAYLGLEEVLKAFTEHWMVVFGPLILVMALVGKRGLVGLIGSAQSWRPRWRRNPADSARPDGLSPAPASKGLP